MPAKSGKAWRTVPEILQDLAACRPQEMVMADSKGMALTAAELLSFAQRGAYLLARAGVSKIIAVDTIPNMEQMKQLEIARHVQQRLLPQHAHPLKTAAFGGRCLPAREIGGDYYDFLDLGPGRLGVLLADVSGKGVAAALLTANLQASFRSQLELGMKHPKALLSSVNKLFHESTPAEYFATMFFAEYRDQTRELRYINCGHPAALLVRANGKIEHLEATALPIGIFAAWSCEEKSVIIAPGDVLIAFSDGVLEAGVERGEEFGETRLIDVLGATRTEDLEQMLDSVIGEVLRFSPGMQSDDVTLVALRAHRA